MFWLIDEWLRIFFCWNDEKNSKRPPRQSHKQAAMDHKRSHGCEKYYLLQEKQVFPREILKNFPERRSGSAGKSYPVWDSAPVRRVLKNPEDWNVFSYGYYDRRRKGICIFV